MAIRLEGDRARLHGDGRVEAVRITIEEYEALRRIFRWRLAYWLTFAAAVPAVGLAIELIRDRGWLAMAAAPTAVLIVHAIAWRKTNLGRCPRCHGPFFNASGPLGSTGTTLPTPRRCQGCGLPYERPDPAT
ncbi:MAG: hypothetical protein HYX75_15965 [Acidobacteria bacterium]|nr:hypothetical protein [Acidobacteriota bacterium]